MSISFNLSNEDEARAMAVYVAQLVREGVTFRMIQYGTNITVELTGGY